MRSICTFVCHRFSRQEVIYSQILFKREEIKLYLILEIFHTIWVVYSTSWPKSAAVGCSHARHTNEDTAIENGCIDNDLASHRRTLSWDCVGGWHTVTLWLIFPPVLLWHQGQSRTSSFGAQIQGFFPRALHFDSPPGKRLRISPRSAPQESFRHVRPALDSVRPWPRPCCFSQPRPTPSRTAAPRRLPPGRTVWATPVNTSQWNGMRTWSMHPTLFPGEHTMLQSQTIWRFLGKYAAFLE